MPLFPHTIIPVLLALLLAGCASPPETPEERSAAVDEVVRNVMDDSGVPGAAVAVVQHGDVVYRQTYGVADRATGRPVTDSTLFQLASASKPIAGVVLMTLVDDGRPRLDDPIHEHLPDLTDAWRGVTVRQAMSHTAGLPRMLNPETGDLLGGETTAEAFRKAQQKPLADTTTRTWSYNQIGYEVARRVMETAADTSYEALADARVFTPAGMSGTHFLGQSPPSPEQVVTGYREGPEAMRFDEAYEYYVPTAAGVFSSTSDLVRMMDAVATGDLLSPGARRAMWTSAPFEESEIGAITGYGIGWTVDEQDGHRRVWHSGGGATMLMHFPDDALTVVYLTNRFSHDVITPATDVADLYLTPVE